MNSVRPELEGTSENAALVQSSRGKRRGLETKRGHRLPGMEASLTTAGPLQSTTIRTVRSGPSGDIRLSSAYAILRLQRGFSLRWIFVPLWETFKVCVCFVWAPPSVTASSIPLFVSGCVRCERRGEFLMFDGAPHFKVVRCRISRGRRLL